MSATDILNSTKTNFWWLAIFMITDLRSWINDIILNCKQWQSHQWFRHCNPRHISPYFCAVLFSITLKACTELIHISQIFQYVIILNLHQFHAKHTATANYIQAATCRILLVYAKKHNTVRSSCEDSKTHNYTNNLPKLQIRSWSHAMTNQIRPDETRHTTNSNTEHLHTYTDQPRILGGAHNLGLSIHIVLLITFTFCRCRWRCLPRKFHGFKENRKKRKICAWTIQIKVYNKDKQQHSIWCECSYSIAREMGTIKKNGIYKNKSYFLGMHN